MLNLLDLFSGIGGFSLSAKWALGDKVKTIGFCEIDEFCHIVLRKQFKNVPIYNDVRELTPRKMNYKQVDIVTGGFPCQDISMAGKGAGIEGERSGLWKEMFRIIRQCKPRWAIIENVSALTHRGLTVVLNDLAKAGYDAEWQCIQAKQVGAPHKRERIWVVAYPHSRNVEAGCGELGICQESKGSRSSSNAFELCQTISYPSSLRLQCQEEDKELEGERSSEQGGRDRIQEQKGCISESRLGGVANGIPNWVHEPRGVPRVDKKKPNRVERMKALGNSIVPQIPYLIFSRIKELENL
tara:strand:- start:1966 stop:2859 length:894 start_codon:yes stop_codon:yes gene_type:complete